MEKTFSIYNNITGETIVRPMTEDEIAEYDKGTIEAAERKKAVQEAKKAKEIAQAKLAVLGLTLDDLQALGL